MRIIRRRYLILILLGVCLGFYASYKLFVEPGKSKETWYVPTVQDLSKKFITEDTLINQIHQKQELITLELEMSEKVTLDNSWGNLEVFKKVKNINYFGTGIFVADLSGINADTIEVDNSNLKISINVPFPKLKSVTINEEKTEYETTERGLLRFGEIKLTPEEDQTLIKNVKDKMTKTLSANEFLAKANNATENSLKALVQTIVQNAVKENYEIQINFNN